MKISRLQWVYREWQARMDELWWGATGNFCFCIFSCQKRTFLQWQNFCQHKFVSKIYFCPHTRYFLPRYHLPLFALLLRAPKSKFLGVWCFFVERNDGIQLLESPIPTTPTTTTTSQKASSGDISGTKRGSIDPLVSRGGRYIDEKLSKADKSVFLKLSAIYRYRKMKKNWNYQKIIDIGKCIKF